jgi:hypothetical protein
MMLWIVAEAEDARLPSWYVKPRIRVRSAGGLNSMRWIGIGPQTPPTKNCWKKAEATKVMFRGRMYAGTMAPPKTQAVIMARRRPVKLLMYPTVVPPMRAPIWPTTVMAVTSEGPSSTWFLRNVG